MESGKIQIGGHQFEIFIEKDRIGSKINEIADWINDFYGSQKVQVLVLLEGAEPFANQLLPHLNFPFEKTELKLKSYEGFHSTHNLQIPKEFLSQLSISEPILIIEDIIDSGHTLFELLSFLGEHGFKNIQIATLLHKPTCLKYPIQPRFVGFEIGPEFVIGFGMDIDECGRELDCIYKLHTGSLL